MYAFNINRNVNTETQELTTYGYRRQLHTDAETVCIQKQTEDREAICAETGMSSIHTQKLAIGIDRVCTDTETNVTNIPKLFA